MVIAERFSYARILGKGGLTDVSVEAFQDRLISKQTGQVYLGQTRPVLLLGKNIMMPTSISRFAGCVLDSGYGRNEHGWLFELQRGKNS